MRVPTWLKWVAVLILMMTTIVIPLVLLEERSDVFVAQVVEWSGNQPMVAAGVIILALTSDVLFPVPNGIINTAAGSLFGWTFGAVVIWIGLTIGCLVGYGFGKLAGQPVARKLIGEGDLARAEEFGERLGGVTLVVTRTVPMFGDLATIAAGMVSYPFRRFILITGLANVGVAIIFGGIGAAAVANESGWLAFVGAVAIPLIAWVGYKLFTRDADA